jgi:hypothetical protein
LPQMRSGRRPTLVVGQWRAVTLEMRSLDLKQAAIPVVAPQDREAVRSYCSAWLTICKLEIVQGWRASSAGLGVRADRGRCTPRNYCWRSSPSRDGYFLGPFPAASCTTKMVCVSDKRKGASKNLSDCCPVRRLAEGQADNSHSGYRCQLPPKGGWPSDRNQKNSSAEFRMQPPQRRARAFFCSYFNAPRSSSIIPA